MILQALAHAPASRYELSFLVGMTPDEVSDAIFDQLAPEGLVEMAEDSALWSITDAGRAEIAAQAARSRDAKCQGVRS